MSGQEDIDAVNEASNIVNSISRQNTRYSSDSEAIRSPLSIDLHQLHANCPQTVYGSIENQSSSPTGNASNSYTSSGPARFASVPTTNVSSTSGASLGSFVNGTNDEDVEMS